MPMRLRHGLLGTTSLVSLATGTALLGLGSWPAHAAGCTVNVGGNVPAVTNSTAIDCIFINGATVAGNVTNGNIGTINAPGPGVPSSTGIGISNSTINGALINSGSITSFGQGINVSDAIVTGGITNEGTISAGAHFGGIETGLFFSFAGPIVNSGTISAGTGIAVDAATYSGGVTNSGTITGTHNGIAVAGIATFAGGITNTGTITANNFNAIQISDTTAFSGGITNGGTLSGNQDGIFLLDLPTFGGGITNTGLITGNIGIGANNAAGISIFDSGTITGTSGIAIQFAAGTNTLTLGPGFTINGTVIGSGSDIFQLGGVGNGTFDLSTIGAAKQYDGFATFNVVGATWTVINALGQSSPWVVQSGTLLVNGDLSAASSLTVTGGTLGGTGVVGNTQINSGGTFAPGTPGSPGTSITVSGNLAFQSGALFLVQVNPTTASFANVTGTATLAGNVLAAFASGSYLQKQYTILQSGGLSGTFAGVTATDLPGFSVSLSYTADDVLLNIRPALSTNGLNVNQANVGTGLTNYFNGGGPLPASFVPVFGLTGGNLANALSQLDGEAATDAEKGAFQLMTQFLGLMLDPFVYGRGGGSGGGQASGFAPEQKASLPPDIALAYDAVLKAPPSFDQRWTVWGASYGGSSTTNGDPVVGSNNVTANTFGFAGGADYRFTPDTAAGFALAGGGTNWGLAQGLGGGRSDAFQAGVYGITHDGPAYLAAALAFTNNWFTTSRTALGDQLTASFAGQSFGARLEAGYRYAAMPALGVTPYAAVQAQSFHTPAYSETDVTGGGLGLSYNTMNASDVRSELGARFDDLQTIDGMPVVLRARVAWAHDWVSNPALGAVFEQLPGASFVVNGAAPPPDSALASLGAQFYFTPALSLLAKFDGEFAPGAQTYAGSGTLRYTW